jgi:hypothetical protein
MIYLASTSDKLQVVTSSANPVHVHATFTDLSGTTVTPDRTDTSIGAATTTDVVASPGASTTRKIKFLSVFNDHATAAQNIVIRHTDGTTVADLWAGSVPAQTGVTFDEKCGWRVASPFPSANIQTFDAPGGTWTKPAGPRTGLTLIRLWGGGGGGGGGASLATAAVAKGGSGGGGGACVSQLYLTDELPEQFRVIIGAGGGGGPGGLAGQAGTTGADGRYSAARASTYTLLFAYGGAAGTGGQTSALATTGGGGAGFHGINQGAVNASAASGQPTNGSNSSPFGPTWEGGSGGGGSSNSATVPVMVAGGNARFGGGGGGSGGCHSNVPANIGATAGGGTGNSVGATAGGLGGAAGTSGASPTAGQNGVDTDGIVGGTGGGGGGTTVTASTAGAAGGNGGKGGGGGGGGGVGMNPGVGGKGGNGGAGFGIIISW